VNKIWGFHRDMRSDRGTGKDFMKFVSQVLSFTARVSRGWLQSTERRERGGQLI
jgi:hypothetical protein